MSDRRMVLSTSLLQEQVIACCCGVLPGVAADLALDHILSVDRGLVTCTLAVTNKGPARAANVVVTVVLEGAPVGQVIRFEPDQNWVHRDPGRPFVADLGNIQPDQTAQLRLLMVPRGGGLLTAKAAVKSSTVDLDPSNNEVTRSIAISEQMLRADLSASIQTSFPGSERGLIRVDAGNRGPATVFGARVSLQISSGGAESVRFRVVSLSPGWETRPSAGPLTQCRLNATVGMLEGGTSRALDVDLQRISGGRTLIAKAEIRPPTGISDPEPGNNSELTEFDF